MVQHHLTGISGKIKPAITSPLKEWQQLHFGMFIHLGLYSELGGVWNNEKVTKGYSEQIQMWANISKNDYEKIAHRFTLEKFDPQAVCSLAKEAGMTYIVITSKHHDGFCLFDTKTTDYNAVKASPFKKDVLKLLSDECKKQGLGFGVYFSLVDWHLGHDFNIHNNNTIPKSMEPVIEEQLTELMTNYGSIVEVWFDMSSPTVEQSKKLTRIIRNHQPKAAINGRIWNNGGDFRTLNDNQVPANILDGPWQTPASIYHATWGYRSWQVRDDFHEKVLNLLQSLISVRARGGNYLLNIGPRGDGSIVEFEANVLKSIGAWLERHPNAIINAQPTVFEKHTWGEITLNGGHLFLHIFDLPANGKITLSGLATTVIRVVEDTTNDPLEWIENEDSLTMTLPDRRLDDIVPVIRVELDGDLRIFPRRRNARYFQPKDIEYGYNYVDSGNYTSLKETNVRQTVYVVNEQNNQVFVTIQGLANESFTYHLQLGSHIQIVKGKNLIDSNIGPFPLGSEHDILPLHITLYEPDHKYQDIELKIDSITIA